MTPKTYQSLRNELIGLLKKAAALDAVREETRNTLLRICKKTMENQFEIVLAGEFQGGKSTTFNTLCDGRELSPAGSGIKTSGCIVSARNISAPDEPEKALIRWRSSADLIAGFSDLLLPHLQSLLSERFGKVSASELGRVINLERKADRGLVAKATAQEWQIWEKNKAGYDPEQKGTLDILRAATLVTHHYADEYLHELRQRDEFSLEAARKMMAFPKDWEERWMNKNPARFPVREVLFTFIRNIRLRLRSDNLGRLGCVLTDCPGLFASRWDTDTARRAMFSADAILYLFDGSRTMKLSDLRALQFVRQNGMEYKLFYGCNMRSHTLEESRRILSSTVTLLKNHGFRAEENEFALFHALLALHSVQGQRLITGTLDKFTEQRLGESREDAGERLARTISRQLFILDMNADYRGMDAVSLESARKASGLDQLMEMVEKTVIRKKAKAVLIDNGSQMAANSLLEAEGALRTRENTALKKEREFLQNVELAERSLRKFESDCYYILRRMEDESPDYMLANNIWDRLERRKEDLSRKTTERIYKEVVSSFSISLFMERKFKDKLIGIIKEEIDDMFAEVIHSWTAEIKDGKNVIYNAQIVRRITTTSRELKEIWEKSGLPEMNLLAGITLPEFSGNLELDNARIFQELEKGQLFDDVRYNAILATGGLTGAFTAASGILVAVFVLISRLFWVRIVTVVGLLVNIILMFLTRGMVEKSMKEEIQQRLSPTIDTLFYEVREDVKKEFQGFSASIRELYTHVFSAAVNRPQQIFEERKAGAEADFKKSREDRQAIAREAKRIREESIRPLRVSLQEFVSRMD